MVISKRILRISLFIIVVLSLLYFLWVVRFALYPFIIGLLLAYLLNPAVCYIEKKGLKRGWAIIVVYVLLFGSILVGAFQLIPILLRDLNNFALDLPLMIANVNELLEHLQDTYDNSTLPYSLRLAIDASLLSLEGDVQTFISQLVSGFINIIGYAIGLIISPILAFYLLNDWYKIKEKLLMLLPSKWRNEILLFLKDVDKVLSGIIRGQVTVAFIVGFLVTIVLYLLGLKFALIIGILAAMFDVIPYFGPIIGASPAVMLALLQSSALTIKVIILFFIIHQLEGNIIHPKILGENVGLHPLTVIFCVFVGGEVAGIVGMLVGVPIVAITKVFAKHVLKFLL